jgi:putative two-component system response regulator
MAFKAVNTQRALGTMIQQLSQQYEHENGVPFRDSLTSLYTHGVFQIALDNEIKRAERTGKPFALALIDIDWFSFFNKRFGHGRGDRRLKAVADVITENIREADMAARFSGDVFSVLFPELTSTSALQALERIRSGLKEMGSPGPTISAGVATFPQDGQTRDALLQKVTDGLHKAKSRGKDQCYYFKTDSPEETSEQARVLIVDDSDLNLKLLTGLLQPLQYEVLQAQDGEQALNLAAKNELDLVLLDIMMPGMDGFEVCRRLKANERTRMLPIILVTALDDLESRIQGIEAGADDFITKPPNKMELIARTKSLVKIKRLNKNLASIENVLFSLAKAVEAKDAYTQGHVERVSNMSQALGRKMDLTPEEMEALRFGGILHDVGKIGIPNAVINKPGPLNDEEWAQMRSHPEVGYQICLPLEKTLGAALEVIRHHHEKLDGSGYPDGLKGEEISKVARIMAVADIYDALVTDRAYRKGMPKALAFKILRKEAGEGKLDQQIVEALVNLASKQEDPGNDTQG